MILVYGVSEPREEAVAYQAHSYPVKCIDRILGESKDDPLQSFLDLLRILMDFGIDDATPQDFERLVRHLNRRADGIDGLDGSRVWGAIWKYLDFVQDVTSETGDQKYDTIEDRHQEEFFDLANEVIVAIGKGQFNPNPGMVQSVLSGDPFEEKYSFSSVTPQNRHYLQEIVYILSGGPWYTPEDVADEISGRGLQ